MYKMQTFFCGQTGFLHGAYTDVLSSCDVTHTVCSGQGYFSRDFFTGIQLNKFDSKHTKQNTGILLIRQSKETYNNFSHCTVSAPGKYFDAVPAPTKLYTGTKPSKQNLTYGIRQFFQLISAYV
jgi:hypothetical protein